MNQKCKISIITPIYNVENYLKQCFESIRNQSFTDFEVLMINDGSTDGSKDICIEYSKLDSRFILYNKVNGGLSDARNYGLDRARGDYIFLVDSDDFLYPNALELLWEQVKSNEIDIVIGNHNFVYDSGKEKIYDSKKFDFLFTPKEALENMLYQKAITNSAWAKLYKKSLFDEIRYPKGYLYEDLATTHKLFMSSKKIKYIHSVVYGYRQRQNSIMKSDFNQKKLDLLTMVDILYTDVVAKYPSLEKAASSRRVSAYMQTYLLLPKNGYEKIKSDIVKVVKQNRMKILFDPKTRIKNKIGVLLVDLI